MKRIGYPLALVLAALAATTLATPAAQAAPPAIVLQPETVKLKPSTLPGYAIAQQKCAICHSADYVSYQPPGMTLAQWTAEMAKMKKSYGAPIDDGEVQQLGAYLAVAYGAAKAEDPEVRAVVAKAGGTSGAAGQGQPAAAGGAVDVQALLQKNACLSCHAVQQKVVGPAYHDIAAKYKADPQAHKTLEASIRQGSSGKWGNVPMPPFAALSAQELQALAAFVLQQ